METSSTSHYASRTPVEINEEEKNSFKLIKMSYDTARSVLLIIFKWGTLQAAGQTLSNYLLNTKGYSNGKLKRYFDASQRLKISDPAVLESSYDITLLIKAIYHACDKLETEDYSESSAWSTKDEGRIEWLLTVIKNFRNKVSHSELGITKEEMILQAAELMAMLEKALRVAGALYNQNPVEVEEKLNKIRDDIKNIRDQSLGPADLNRYEVMLLNEKLKDILQTQGSSELKNKYKNCSQLNPVSHLEGKRVFLQVKSIFTQIEVESAGDKTKGSLVPCEDIIMFCRNNSSDSDESSTPQPEVYLIEGPAGSGKTTLMKYIKSEWSSSSCSMKGLSDFDLLLFMECRNPSLSSFSQLLDHLLHLTNIKYYKEGEIQKFILGLKTLLVVDGLDEMNSSSEKLFLEILNLKSDKFVVLCTSRPEKVRYFHMHTTSEFHTAHLKIIGIADQKREEFISKYHSEMVRLGLSVQDTDSLLKYMRKTMSRLQRHFRLPLNLVVLVWLWADDPSRLSKITTSSELYIETLKLMMKKLIERLAHNDKTRSIDLDVLDERVKVFVTSMCREALVSLRWDMIEKFLPESVIQMKTTCSANCLPIKEVLSAFLVINIVDGEEKVSIPHKLLHEFYASLWIKQSLFNENNKTDNSEFLQKLAVFLEMQKAGSTVQQQNIISDAMMRLDPSAMSQKPGAIRAIISELHKGEHESLKLTKYQSLFLQVAGVLYAQNTHQVEECTAEEIVQLLNEAELGHEDNNEWLDLLDNTKNNSIIIKHVSRHITKNLTITDDHVEAALLLLENAKPKEIKVDIADKSESIPDLQVLLEKVANCNCHLDLYFRQDFKNPSTILVNDQHLSTVVPSCKLREFLGNISGEALTTLPDTTMLLNLAVASDIHAADLMHYLQESAPHREWVGLCLHITSNVSPSSLQHLPDIMMMWLLLSDVDDSSISRVCEVAAKLLPPDAMFVDVRFPRARISAEGWKELLNGMKETQIRIGHLTIPDEVVLLEEELRMLKDAAHSLLRCDFRRHNFNITSLRDLWTHPREVANYLDAAGFP